MTFQAFLRNSCPNNTGSYPQMRMDVTLDNNDIERSSEKSLRLLCRIARMNGFGATELSENNFITRVSIQDSRAGDYAADYSKVVRLVKLFRAAGFGVQINPPPPWISQDYPD
ncbi:MAG: hypothetical protein R3D66_02120, partial [Alphaproteobacteria bacterium]